MTRVAPRQAMDQSPAERWSIVERQFDFLMALPDERGGELAVVQDNELVVDLAAGPCSRESNRPLRTIFSGTKALAATVAAIVLNEHDVNPRRPMSEVWPDFGARGKGDITIEQCLTHTAGLPAMVRDLPPSAIPDVDLMAEELAAQPVIPEAHARLVYHALTFGWLTHGLVKAITGQSIGEVFSERIAQPLALEAWLGLPEVHQARVVDLVTHPLYSVKRLYPTELSRMALARPPLFETLVRWNSREWRAAEIPAANAVADARSLARFMGMLAAGGDAGDVRIVDREVLGAATRQRVAGVDPITGTELAFARGFAVNGGSRSYGQDDDAFGHGGHGGALLAAWPSKRIGLCFLPGVLRNDPADYRAQLLADAVWRACAGG